MPNPLCYCVLCAKPPPALLLSSISGERNHHLRPIACRYHKKAPIAFPKSVVNDMEIPKRKTNHCTKSYRKGSARFSHSKNVSSSVDGQNDRAATITATATAVVCYRRLIPLFAICTAAFIRAALHSWRNCKTQGNVLAKKKASGSEWVSSLAWSWGV
ncbi:hypothetical protein L6452_28625 [Arctium lappa]|uniref:Uncharacterized protein n=1 Tax=Arctium lappa TaxID=4217 RepID=A0ACB8ZYD3_ARCLA|nr:hypothetical protein L6452_28625 [Arctium lappa]